jgi:hypothetical protein
MELLIELPDVFVFPPEDDPVQDALCVWDSKTEAVISDVWDADSSETVKPHYQVILWAPLIGFVDV